MDQTWHQPASRAILEKPVQGKFVVWLNTLMSKKKQIDINDFGVNTSSMITWTNLKIFQLTSLLSMQKWQFGHSRFAPQSLICWEDDLVAFLTFFAIALPLTSQLLQHWHTITSRFNHKPEAVKNKSKITQSSSMLKNNVKNQPKLWIAGWTFRLCLFNLAKIKGQDYFC